MKRVVNGLIVIDKPTGMTSRDAVDRAQAWFPRRTKIGHTGTLDPLATGVLVVCIGKATRLAHYVQAMDKTYRTTWMFGGRSDTDDADGTIVPVAGLSPIDETVIREALEPFLGAIAQKPPAYSAVKIDGKRAHDLARRGQEVEIRPRSVTIYEIDVLRYCWPELDLEIRCGKGTYIRSLARDLGEKLGCGAYVEKLRRTRVGPFSVENAVSLDIDPSAVDNRLLPVCAAVSQIPSIRLTPAEVDTLEHGQAIAVPPCDGDIEIERAAYDERDDLIGIVGHLGTTLRPIKIFNSGL